MNWKTLITMTLVGLISATAAVGLYSWLQPEPTVVQAASYPPTRLAGYDAPILASPGQPIDFTAAAALSTPAVVHVKTTYKVSSSSNSRNLDFFFRDFFGQEQMPYQQQQQPRQASGSGVIVSSDGYIVTNNHVVDNAEEIEVILYDKKTLKAKLIGTDPSTDLALLKVETQALPHMPFGNSDSVRIGEWVLAVGNPFELENTVTAGIVSAKGRNINILSRGQNQPAIESFIQTDAAVNPGNSGGALVNTRGELIGINTAIATPTGTFAGYSFAVPVNIVRKVIVDLMDYGIVQRAYLGVLIDVNKDDLGGVYISEIIPGTASAESELRVGDVITKINNFKVTSFPQLQEQVSKYQPGDQVSVDFLREGKERRTTLTLKNADKSTSLLSKPEVSSSSTLGVTLQALEKSELERFKIERGVKVAKIGQGLLAQRTRIADGFIITGVNDQPVSNPQDVESQIKNSKGTATIEGFYPNYPYKIYNYSLLLD
ncbi:MAG: Do family serine endopeptidase [Bacteroidetes bacterium]|nr:Do family serine endopeptidase [Bacteroidota bacterium]